MLLCYVLLYYLVFCCFLPQVEIEDAIHKEKLEGLPGPYPNPNMALEPPGYVVS